MLGRASVGAGQVTLTGRTLPSGKPLTSRPAGRAHKRERPWFGECVDHRSLARNGCDWHTLIEFYGLVKTLLNDEDGVYDPRLPNDRLLLGLKEAMSERELATLRQRAQAGDASRPNAASF